MSYTPPKLDWAGDGVGDADFLRIEGNIASLHSGGGQTALADIPAAESLAINAVDDVFNLTGADYTQINYIATEGRQPGNKIKLIRKGVDYVAFYRDIASPPTGYAAIQAYPADTYFRMYPYSAFTFVYDGTDWILEVGPIQT